MNYSGVVYVFDFDDTLYWAPDWYGETKINRDGFVNHPGESNTLNNALTFFKELSLRGDVPEALRGLQIKTEKRPQLDGRDIYFEITNAHGAPVPFKDLAPFMTPEVQSATGIRINKNFSPFAVITNDDDFYLRPETVGNLGENKEVLDLYKSLHNKSVILTARRNIPGMNEKIENILKDYPPMYIYTQPIDSKSSGRYKGNVLVSIASQPKVTKVVFYDDNLKYIQRAQEYIDQYDEENNANLKAKIEMNPVSTSDKPISKLRLAHAYSCILSRDPYLRKVGFVDKYINELYDGKD